MSHSIALWHAILSAPNGPLRLAPGQAGEDLPAPEDSHDAVAELMRRYPGLSRALAEYLAR